MKEYWVPATNECLLEDGSRKQLGCLNAGDRIIVRKKVCFVSAVDHRDVGYGPQVRVMAEEAYDYSP